MTQGSEGPGNTLVGLPGIILSTTYLAAMTLLLLYTLIQIWPVPTPAGVMDDSMEPVEAAAPAGSGEEQAPAAGQVVAADAEVRPLRCEESESSRRVLARVRVDGTLDPACVTVFGSSFPLWAEQRLLLIVLLTGALGGLLHGLRSIAWYVGNRSLVYSWLATYMLMPFTGAAIAFVFYVVIRGGFFAPSSGIDETSPFGFAAMSTIVGLFSTQAVLKLKQVAETMLTSPPKGKDAVPQEEPEAADETAAGVDDPASGHPLPVIRSLEPESVDPTRDGTVLEIRGVSFVEGATVRVGQTILEPLTVTDEVIRVDIPRKALANGAEGAEGAGGEVVRVPVVVRNPAPGGGASRPHFLVLTEGGEAHGGEDDGDPDGGGE